MDQKYRGLYFLAATLGIGLIIIGGMKVFSPGTPTPGATKNAFKVDANTHHALENKIKEFSGANFSPKQYNNILIEINSGAGQNLFNQDIRRMLVDQLNVKYRDLANRRIEFILKADPLDQIELETLVSHLEGTFGPEKEYREIKANLNAFRYYTVTLPQKVEFLIKEGFAEFDEGKFDALKAELEGKPNLHPLFRNKKAVVSTQRHELQRLQTFYQGYLDWNLEVLN